MSESTDRLIAALAEIEERLETADDKERAFIEREIKRSVPLAIRKLVQLIMKDPRASEAQKVQAAKTLAEVNGISFREQWKRLQAGRVDRPQIDH